METTLIAGENGVAEQQVYTNDRQQAVLTGQKEQNAALIAAIRREDITALRAAIGAGADVNHRLSADEGEFTPLHVAVFERNGEAVEELLRIPGIETNAQDREGNTALKSAVYRHLDCIVALLLSYHGVDTGISDYSGRTAWDHAHRDSTKHGERIRALLSRSEDPSKANGDKRLRER